MTSMLIASLLVSLSAGVAAGYWIGADRSRAELRATTAERDRAFSELAGCEGDRVTAGVADDLVPELGAQLADCRAANASCAWAFRRLAERETGCARFLTIAPEVK